MYGTWKLDWNQCKLTDYHYGCDRYYLFLHRWSEVRTLDRFYSGFCPSDRCNICPGLPSCASGLAHLDGGFGAIAHALTTEHKFLAVDQPIFNANIFKDSVFIMIVGAGFNTMGSYVSSQDIVQRFTTTTDTKKLNKMMLTNGALSQQYSI